MGERIADVEGDLVDARGLPSRAYPPAAVEGGGGRKRENLFCTRNIPLRALGEPHGTCGDKIKYYG